MGISLVSVNSQKGKYYFEEIKSQLVLEEVGEDKAKYCSRHLWLHPEANKHRTAFFNRLKTMSFEKAAWKYLRPQRWYEKLYERIINKIIYTLGNDTSKSSI